MGGETKRGAVSYWRSGAHSGWPYRGRVVQVCTVERRQLRVELGEKAKKDSADVFSFTQVCRESARNALA